MRQVKIGKFGSASAFIAGGLSAAMLVGCLDKTDPVSPRVDVVTDTLRNHSDSAELYLPVYESPQSGPILGHNSMLRQQYAEKYFIAGSGQVAGVILHAGGVFANPNNVVDVNVRAVGVDGLPGTRLGGKVVRYADLNLTGAAHYVAFFSPVDVVDSFFVSFDLGDYGHGGFEGDTLGLYACKPGCRDTSDLTVYARTVVQRHNHARVDWRDFYYQNLTPLAIHFALYPVGEGLRP